MLHVIEYVAKSLKIIRNGTLEQGVFKSLSVFHYNCLYLVPFLRYSASDNGVTLKSGLEVIQGHGTWYYSKAWVRFPIGIL